MKPLDDGLKQRLIGAIILLALGVIFLPVLFERDPIKPVDRESQIPPAPEIITVDILEPEVPEEMDLAPHPEDMYVPDEDQPVSLTEEPPGLSEQGVPKSWVLQIGSFADHESAERLRQRLADDGFAVYTRVVNLESSQVTRVFIGPKLDKSTLLGDKQKIDALLNVEAILLEFKPN